MSHVLVAPQAEADMEAILDYIAADNEDAAEVLRGSLYESFAMLAEFPSSGHFRTDLVGNRPSCSGQSVAI